MANRAEEIMDVAYRLLVEKGYHNFSYADIADEIGIRKASIHYHFATKDELVLRVVQRYRRGIHGQIAQLQAGDLSARAQFQLYLDFWQQALGVNTSDVCLCMHLGSEVPTLSAPIQAEVQGHFAELTAWVRDLLQASHVDARALDAEADAMVAAVHGAMLSARTFRDASYFSAISQQVLARLAA